MPEDMAVEELHINSTSSAAAILSSDEKCGDDMVHYRPYGGATTFAEVEAQKAVMEYAMSVEMETSTLRGIIDNILSDPEIESGDKAGAISRASEDYKKRITDIQNKAKAAQKHLEKGGGVLNNIKTFLAGKPEANKELVVSPVIEETIPLPDNRGFKVYRDKSGNLRWLTLSSNAFEDKDGELFTTKALEEAIEHADKEGERGPLLVYHVPGTVIGQCDYQAMAGRFLIESGTFDDTPLGRKAVEYFVSTEEEHQVSIGFEYHDGDELDGIFDWLRIKERSITPYGAAANPWTDFKIVGDKALDENKVATLKKIFGEELSVQVIEFAETKTKELEASTRFKEAKSDEDEEDKNKMEEKKEEETKEPESAEVAPPAEAASDGLTQIASLLTNLTEAVSTLQAEVKELKKSEEDKISELMTPRWSLPGGIRPTESDKNIIKDEMKIKELADQDAAENEALNASEKAALGYVQDLIRPGVRL